MSTYLLDTNTVSYFLRDHSPALSSRLLGMAPESLVISVITAGELRFGLKRLGASQRAAALAERLVHILESFATLPCRPKPANTTPPPARTSKPRAHPSAATTSGSPPMRWLAT